MVPGIGVRAPWLELVSRLGDVVYPQKDGGWYAGREQKQPDPQMAEGELREPGGQKSFWLSS